MKRIVWSILFISLLALAFCSGDKGAAPAQPVSWNEKNEPRAAQAAPPPAPLSLKNVALAPEAPTALDDVSALAELVDPEAAGAEFRYQWYVNGQEIAGIDNDKLEKKYFKKGAWIYCRAQAFSEAKEGDWLKSDTIRVLNSLPALQLGPLGDVRVPGELRYQAAASDPDDDELTFEVLSPLEQGIAIDAKTGLLSWMLTEETVKKLGENIEIQIAVSDGEGEKVTGTISLQFTTTKQ